jgi:hypothetical protein
VFENRGRDDVINYILNEHILQSK